MSECQLRREFRVRSRFVLFVSMNVCAHSGGDMFMCVCTCPMNMSMHLCAQYTVHLYAYVCILCFMFYLCFYKDATSVYFFAVRYCTLNIVEYLNMITVSNISAVTNMFFAYCQKFCQCSSVPALPLHIPVSI